MQPLDGDRLHEHPDERERTAPTRSLDYLGTTANPAEFNADLEHIFRLGVAGQLAALVKRRRRALREARSAERRHDWPRMLAWTKSATWAESRARALGLPRAELVAACGKRWRTVACGCGQVELPVGCDQTQLCTRCRRAHWKVWRKRITRSLVTHYKAALATWREEVRRAPSARPRQPRIYLLTLTCPHSGDIARDRREMGAAWREFYKVANERAWWSCYAAAYELGAQEHKRVEDREGNLHLHVAVISRWLPYEELHAAWRAAMPGAVVLDVQASAARGKHGARRKGAAGGAADYLASYVTKGVDPATMTGAKAGELLVAFRGRRKVTTSAHFWVPKPPVCPVCNVPHRLAAMPPSLLTVAPGAVFRSQAESYGVWIPRAGPPQKPLAYGAIPPD